MDNSKIKQYLSNLYENYMIDSKNSVSLAYKAKCFGAMEAALVILDVLKPGTPFVYLKTFRSFKILWIFPIQLKKEESYEEHILRLVDETLNK